MKRTSRIPGFYKASLAERRALVAEAIGLPIDDLDRALAAGGLAPEIADKLVENVIGTYALPFGVALNVRVNGRDHLAPMVVEEPSVVAAASNAAKIVRAGGGFTVESDAPVMTTQIEVHDVPDAERACERVVAEREALLRAADASVRGLVERGGGARGLDARVLARDVLVVHVHVDCRDAMGANLVNTVAEALGARIAELAGGKLGLRILTNLSDRRCTRVTCRVPVHALAKGALDGPTVARGVVSASRFAELDPYRAATHNKGIMNGIDAVCLATGNDWRAIEAGAHAFAARSGRYAPLSTWRLVADALPEPLLEGRLEIPLAFGTVGGTLRAHPAAKLGLAIVGTKNATELAAIAASVGLASNLAALRALSTDGIQRGHMALHARSVALAAGASADDVERVAAMIVEAADITLDGASRALAKLAK